MTDEVAEATERTHVVHFNLEGAWLADLARARVREGCWERALSLLTDSLEGMTHEQAQQILTGRADLTGWANDPEGLGFEELPADHEYALEMNEVHERLYGQVFRWKDEYWKPYAIVKGYCQEDMEHASRWSRTFNASGFKSDRDWTYSVLRPLYYANRPDTDLVVYVSYPSESHGTVVLCEKTRMPPTWFKTPTAERPEHFLAKHLEEGRTWMERGAAASGLLEVHKDRIAAKQQAAKEAPAPKEAPKTQAQKDAERAAQRAEVSGMTAEFLRRLNETESSADISELGREFDERFDELRRESRDPAVQDTLDQADEAGFQRLLQLYRTRIEAQAHEHGGWMELLVKGPDGKPVEGGPAVLRVPKNPFLLWSLRGFEFEKHGKQTPEWQTVCPAGMKMMMDDANHTDWMVGAGLNPEKSYPMDDNCYDSLVQSSASRLRFKLAEQWCQADFVTLSRGLEDRIYGHVVYAEPNQPVPPGSIAIVPHAGPEYQLALESACEKDQNGQPGAVICETGGKLAHLAVVGRELKYTLILLPDAKTRFREDTQMTLDLKKGRLTW